MIFLIAAILLILIIVFMCFWFLKNKMKIVKICFNEHCFLAEVAKTKAQRMKGLMFRENLPSDKAMFFVFEQPSVHNFWMKNCKIPLDIIWLDENYKVVAISPNNQPCGKGDCPSIQPSVLAKYVLEINAGLASQSGFSEGSYFSLQTP